MKTEETPEKLKSDLKFNIASAFLTLLGGSLFLVAIKNEKTMGPYADLIVGAGDFAFLFGLCSTVLAKIRNEPRRALTVVMISVYGLAFMYLLFAVFMLSVVDI